MPDHPFSDAQSTWIEKPTPAPRLRARCVEFVRTMADDAEHAETRQSTAEEIAAFARLLNHPHLERQTAAADEVVNLIGREPCPDDALLGGICHHPDAMEGLTRILLNADDEAKQVACNLLFMLSMSEPDRPFDVSCSAHIANRAIIGETAGLFDAVVAG